MKLDILIVAAHPDDVELGAGGTVLSHLNKGKKIGIIDMTKGELGTNGNIEIRNKEAEEASYLMGIHLRENLGFLDGFFVNDQKHQLEIIKVIRKYRPEILITNAIRDRHPDHRNSSELVTKAAFLSGLRKVNTFLKNLKQNPWRPTHLYYMVQDQYLKPDIVVDITDFWKKKMKILQSYRSQFYVESDKNNNQKEKTYISTPHFIRFLEARAREYGHSIGVEYGEGFLRRSQIGVKSLFDLI